MAVKQMPIRFNLDNPDEAKAYEYLQHIDKKIYPSYTKAVTAAIINLFDGDEEQRVGTITPAVSFSDGSKYSDGSKLYAADEIAAAVKKEISNALPELVAATLMRIMQNSGCVNAGTEIPSEKETVQPPVREPELSESAWKFLDNF